MAASPQHAIDRALKRLRKEEEKNALEIGRGKVPVEKRDERIGLVKGLGRAIELVEQARAAVERGEEDDDQN